MRSSSVSRPSDARLAMRPDDATNPQGCGIHSATDLSMSPTSPGRGRGPADPPGTQTAPCAAEIYFARSIGLRLPHI